MKSWAVLSFCVLLSPSRCSVVQGVSLELGEMLWVLSWGSPTGEVCGISGLHVVPGVCDRHRVSLRPAQSHCHLHKGNSCLCLTLPIHLSNRKMSVRAGQAPGSSMPFAVAASGAGCWLGRGMSWGRHRAAAEIIPCKATSAAWKIHTNPAL